MKTYLLLLFSLLLLTTSTFAQAPQGFQYQAVVRNSSGDPLLNTTVQFRFTIEHSSGNPVYYRESQQVISNALGGINVVIGAGNVLQGNFSQVNWKNGDQRVRVEMDPTGGQDFAPFSVSELQSVPYALYADRAGVLVDLNGNDWNPADDQDEQTLSVNGNQLAITNGNIVTLPTGSGGDNWGNQTIETGADLSGDGTLQSPLEIARQGALNGDVLKWNGNTWAPDTDNGQEYTAGEGIGINGNEIINTGDDDNDPDNEIQSLSLNAGVLSLSNSNSVNLPVYNEGTGIDINGNTISALNTQSLWNANQLQSRNVAVTAPSNGQVLKWNGSNWAPDTDNTGSQLWTQNGNNIYYNTGNVGFGVTAPTDRIHLGSSDNIRFDNLFMGKDLSQSFAFNGFLVPVNDEGDHDLGLPTRRWGVVWAVEGTINTSDARDKTNVENLDYGLEEILRLRPVSYSWINRPESGTKIGLIAQELEEVMPEVVANTERTPSLKGESDQEGELKLGVYYSDLIPVLIKAIQEQEEKISELQLEIEKLKKQ